ncbi:TetR/AcrR family transcriptional regulator [Nocardiopsis sp. NRRL B-16309]|uniref:TetR/AcrR family transcriptional regulator n=1 Tax=Nocardiopsis sp. NRRL B-16309 TaxID=1519494 RepID=UPI0006AED511|nr:TetR/AcrR family transcriptional regulator [Nocardiopsis sp. NRRL B-16309]
MKRPPDDLAQRLLDVSESVLGATPPPRLEDIAKQVGASRAALYYYFAGRDDLLAFLLTTHAQDGARAVHQAIDPDGSPERRLREMVGALADYLAHRPGVCVGLLGALGAAGKMNEVLKANDEWIAGPLRDLLTECHADGAVGVEDVGDAANTMLGGLLHGVLGRAMAEADPTDPRFLERLRDQVLRGVLV